MARALGAIVVGEALGCRHADAEAIGEQLAGEPRLAIFGLVASPVAGDRACSLTAPRIHLERVNVSFDEAARARATLALQEPEQARGRAVALERDLVADAMGVAVLGERTAAVAARGSAAQRARAEQVVGAAVVVASDLRRAPHPVFTGRATQTGAALEAGGALVLAGNALAPFRQPLSGTPDDYAARCDQQQLHQHRRP